MNKNYFPRGDNALIDWVQRFLVAIYDQLNYERWLIMKPSDDLMDLFSDFSSKLAACKLSNRGKLEVAAKNVAKEKLTKAIRDFVQGFLARNVNVTVEDRIMLGLPQRDSTLTSVPQPVTQVEGTLAFRGLRSSWGIHFHPLGGLTGKNECRNFAAKLINKK